MCSAGHKYMYMYNIIIEKLPVETTRCTQLHSSYFTDSEKSPGVLSLSLIKKAPSCGC